MPVALQRATNEMILSEGPRNPTMRIQVAIALGLSYLACLSSAAPIPADAQRGLNLLVNPGFEERTQEMPRGWELLGDGFKLVREGRKGGWCVRCESSNGGRAQGAQQAFAFSRPVKDPLLLSAWSKSSGVEGADYAVYINVFYADGTSRWGIRAPFPRLATDWNRAESLFIPEKPVTRVVVCLNFERAKGVAWFDDVSVSLAPHVVRGVFWGGLAGDGRLDALISANISSTWVTRIYHEGREVFTQAGEGLIHRIEWDGLDPQGRSTPKGRCTVIVEATDALRCEKAVLTRDVDTACPSPGRKYALWTEDSMIRVLPTDLPPDGVVPAAIKLSAARNEAESAQIVLLPPSGAPLRNVRVKVSPLSGPRGARIGTENVEWQQVGYVRLGEHARDHPFIRRTAPAWWPDPLLPVARFDVEPGWAQPVWLTVTVPKDTAPGAYKGTLTISADENPDVVVPVDLLVHPFTLPAQSSLKNSFALMRGYLEKVYGKDSVTPRLRQAFGDLMLAHRLNPDDITATDLPHLADLEHYRPRGLNAFNVLNLAEPRKGEWSCFSPPSFYTQAFKQSLIEKLDPFVAELRRRDLSSLAFVYGFDEREGEYNQVIREFFGLIKGRYGLHTLTTAKVPIDPDAMRALNIDWLCRLTSDYSFENAERCRAAGKQVWSYVCLGPRHPYANFLADDELIEARVIFWQAFQQKFDGFLYWGVNVWWHKNTERPVDPSRGPRLDWSITTNGMPFLHGDGVLIYPLADGRPAASIRLANLRDGLEDYEYLRALGQARGDVWSARSDCSPVTTSLTSFTRDPAALRVTRESIARELASRPESANK